MTVTFPAAVYARRWWVAATAAGCCAVAAALGVWVASTPRAQSLTTPARVRELCDAQFAQYYTSSPAGSFAAQVWTNNALVAAGCITFGVLVGLPTLYLLLNNAVNIGVTGGFMATCGKSDQFFTLILPHGMLELTAVFIAGAVGLRLGWRVLVPGPRRRTEALAAEGRSAVVIALGLVLVLAVSGAVEAKAPLRDIQFCHDLDAGDHGRLKPFGHGFDIMEDAIDSIANPEQILKGLEVDIACPRLDGPRDDEVDEPDDRPFRGHITEVIDILIILSLVDRGAVNVFDDLLHGGPTRAVVLFDGKQNPLFSSVEHADLMAGREPNGVKGIKVERIGHDDR